MCDGVVLEIHLDHQFIWVTNSQHTIVKKQDTYTFQNTIQSVKIK